MLGQLKTHLPAPIGSQLDKVLEGEGGTPDLGDAAKGIGKMFGRWRAEPEAMRP